MSNVTGFSWFQQQVSSLNSDTPLPVLHPKLVLRS
jgi:hypothetical protein